MEANSMLYQSTRNKNLTATGPQAILRGIAPDGGLYMIPELVITAVCASGIAWIPYIKKYDVKS
jgi:hypothetical protein